MHPIYFLQTSKFRAIFIGLLTAAVILTGFGSHTAKAAARQIVVDTLSEDHSYGGPCSYGGYTCLSDAIASANNDTSATSITIRFSISGVFNIGSSVDIKPVGTAPITIDGSGQAITIDGGGTVGDFEVENGSLTLTDLTIRDGKGNSRDFNGGGGIANYANLTLNNVTVSGNTGAYAGGIANHGVLIINSSTISGNTAAGDSGGISNQGTLTINNSTISGNSAMTSGGAITNASNQPLVINNSTIFGNQGGGIDNTIASPSTVYLLSTILSGNTGSDYNGPVTSLGYNLIGNSSGVTGTGFTTTGDKTNVNPNLGTLGNNGGLTQTIPLNAGSPAIGAGNCGGNVSQPIPAVLTDQRGYGRKNTGSGLGCDMGAYETSSPATSTPTSTPTGTPTAMPTATNLPPDQQIDTIGVYRSGTTYLRLSNSAGFADISQSMPGGSPVAGDWTGSGTDRIGVFNTGMFTLCVAATNTLCSSTANQITFAFGTTGDVPISGRWEPGAAYDGIGVFRPSNGLIFLGNHLTSGFADYSLIFGMPGDQALPRDAYHVNGAKLTVPSVFRPSNAVVYIGEALNGGLSQSFAFGYGAPNGNYTPLVGDWTGSLGYDGIGLYNNASGIALLRNSLSTGFPDNSFVFGLPYDSPIAGHWQGKYPPAPRANPVLVPKTVIPGTVPGGISVPNGNQIGD